jgi:hypothetical protein
VRFRVRASQWASVPGSVLLPRFTHSAQSIVEDAMGVRRVLIGVLTVAFALGVAIGSAGQLKKSKGTTAAPGAAGRVDAATSLPRAIDDNHGQGYYCSYATPLVHHLGTMNANWGVVIDFEAIGDTDPIAILTTLKIDGTDVGAENAASDDEGGGLNPRFEVRRNYKATYILTVGSATGDPACYAYRMRIVEP